VLDRLNLSSQPEKEFLSPTVGKSARFSGGGGGGGKPACNIRIVCHKVYVTNGKVI
jgi:hypothetical protein